jgi:[NiFe] hydrogenase diaphorase moiety large subunit
MTSTRAALAAEVIMANSDLDTIVQICAKYGNDRTRMMDVLYDVQSRLGQVSSDAMDAIARALSTTRVEVKSALSFYAFFSDKPKGKFVIRLCNDIIDRMHGVDRVAKAFQEELGIGFGETTPDGMFTLEWTPCIGMSDQAPAALINEKVVTHLSSDSAREIVKTLRESKDLGKLKFPVGSGKNSHPLVHAMVNRNRRQAGPVIFDPMQPGSALHKALAISPVEVIAVVKASRLRGRGGAGFPTGVKWEFTRAADGAQKYVVCNADEGEPGTFKDRVILTEVPDLMFEGMTIAGYAIGAQTGIVYLRGEYAYLLAYLTQVLEDRRQKGLLGKNILGKGFDFDIRIQLGAGAYVCGEETSLISSCEGLRGDPKNRPPFPAQKGYLGMPTVVNNVETHCCAARILEKGAPWFSEFGTPSSTGTKLFSVSGDCERPGVYELAFGIKLRDLLATVGASGAIAVQVGGASGQMVAPKDFDRTLSFDDLATGGAVMVFGPDRDVLEVAQAFLDFFIEESCGYCTPCRVGNRLLLDGLEKIRRGHGEPADLQNLEQLGRTVKTMSRCGLGQTSPNPILSTLENFRAEYEKRVKANTDGYQPTFDLDRAVRAAETIAHRKSVHSGS